MSYFKRLLALLLIALMSLTFVSTHAQNGVYGTTYCGDLSEADCALLTDSITAMQSITSMTVDADVEMLLQGTEVEEGVDSFTMSMTLQGPIEADFAAYYQYLEDYRAAFSQIFDDPSNFDIMALSSNKITAELIDSMRGQVVFEFNVDPALDEGPSSLSTTVVMADGILYMDAESIAATLPDVEPISAQWAGIDLGALMDAQISASTQELDMLDAELFTGEFLEIFSIIGESGFLDLFSDEEFLSEFITVERLDDQEIDGQAIAVFETTTDFAEMLRSARFSDAVYDLVTLLQELDPENTEAIDPVEVQLMVNLFAIMIPDAYYTTELWIGTDDHLQYRLDTRVYYELDASMLGGSDVSEPIILDMDIAVGMSDFNAPVEVEIPTDVEMLDPNELE